MNRFGEEPEPIDHASLKECRCVAVDLGFQGVAGVNHVFVLVRGDGSLVLVETGPASTRDNLLAGFAALGLDAGRVTDVLLTHIHLDHGGDAWWWAARGATIHVHPSAVRHVLDPSRLVAGARSLYGERFDALWGEVRAVAGGRVRAVADGSTVTDLKVRAWHTPGHARHHVVWELDGHLFTGDAAGARARGCDYVSVTAAPPQFDPAAYDETLERLIQRGAKRLWLTHGGAFDDAAAHLSGYRFKVAETFAAVKGWHRDGWSNEQVRQAYQEREQALAKEAGLDDEGWRTMELMNPAALSADGIWHCLQA